MSHLGLPSDKSRDLIPGLGAARLLIKDFVKYLIS